MLEPPRRYSVEVLRAASYAVAALHLTIAVLGALIIAPVLAPDGLGDRMLEATRVEPQVWLLAWLSPPAAAMALVWFATEVRATIDPGGKNPLLLLAVVATSVGAGIEGSACAAATMLPDLARGDPGTYQAVETLVRLGTTAFGNGGFSLGQLLMTRAAARRGAPRTMVISGYGTVLMGAAFMVFGALGAKDAANATNALLFLALIGFALSTARSRLASDAT